MKCALGCGAEASPYRSCERCVRASVSVDDAIFTERVRQEQLAAAGKFKGTCRSPLLNDHERLVVLMEELGEIARAVLDGNEANKREEITQLAACCVAWLEREEAAK